MLAFSLLASATAAIEMPGLQALMAPALNSTLCLRRWRPAGASTKLVFMCERKVKRTPDRCAPRAQLTRQDAELPACHAAPPRQPLHIASKLKKQPADFALE